MSVSSTGKSAIERKVGSAPGIEPLWVRPKTAAIMLDTGLTKIYALLGAGELQSCLDGSARKISTASIKSFVARRLEAERGRMVREPRAAKLPPGGRRRAGKGAASGSAEPPVRPRPPRPPMP
jgi:hypothetical protein